MIHKSLELLCQKDRVESAENVQNAISEVQLGKRKVKLNSYATKLFKVALTLNSRLVIRVIWFSLSSYGTLEG